MKKTYKNPTLTVVKIQPAQFIALSIKDQDAEKAMSRRSHFSRWEDDEYFEE